MDDRVTLRDVADAAGVHMSTASRALNEATRTVVNPQTVERVLRAATRLGYSPHPLARGLRTNRTMTVAIVIPDVENPLFGPIIAGAEERLGSSGYSLLIADARDDEESAIAAVVARRIDGLVLATASREDAAIADLAERRLPAVLVNRSAEGVPFPAIVGDDHAGIGLAIEHLAALGHRRLGHVAGPQSLSTGSARYQAFLSWTQSAGLEASPETCEEASWFQVEPGYQACSRLLGRHPGLTAIVAGNDLLALGCYRAIRERGMDVGSDVSITGYNDMQLLDLMQPPLTSVRVPYRRMGSQAVSILLDMISEGDWDEGPLSVRLAPELVVRGSTRPPPR